MVIDLMTLNWKFDLVQDVFTFEEFIWKVENWWERKEKMTELIWSIGRFVKGE